MRIKELRCFLPEYDEELLVGHEYIIHDIPVILAGILREKQTLSLYLYEAGEDRKHEEEISKKLERKRRRGTLTRREELLMDLERTDHSLLGDIQSIKVNGEKYDFSSGNGGGLEEYNIEGRMMLYHFLEHGLSLGLLEEQDLSQISYMKIGLSGEYDRIPFTKEDMEHLEFITNPRTYQIPVKKKMKVKPGMQSGKKRSFFCEELQKNVDYYINNIELVDTWTEMTERLQEFFKQSETSERQQQLWLEHLQEICPEGMRNVAVEYECEDASLEFHIREELLEKVKIQKGSAVSFFIMGHKKKGNGMHGKKLRSCLIQYPVEADIPEVELELLRAIVQEKQCGSL